MSKSKKPIMSDGSSEESEEEEYEVEKILKMRINPKTKKKEYLVKWENYPFESSTWEPEVNLKNVRDIVDEFEAQQLLRGGSSAETTSTVISALQKKLPSLTVSTKTHTSNPFVSQILPTTAKKPPVFASATSATQSASKKPEKEYEKSQLFLADFARLTQDKLIQENVSDKKQKQVQHREEKIKPNIAKSPSRTESPSGIPFNPNTEDEEFEDGQMEYVFEKIENKRIVNRNAEYLVTFQGLSQSQWVQESDLQDFASEIEVYNQNERIKLAAEVAAVAAAAAAAELAQNQQLLEEQLQNEEFESSNNTSLEKITENGAAFDAVENTAMIDELIINKKGGMSNKSSKATPKMHPAVAITTTPSKHSSGKEQMYLKSGSAKKPTEVREFCIAEEQSSILKKNTGRNSSSSNNTIASNSKKQKQTQPSSGKNKTTPQIEGPISQNLIENRHVTSSKVDDDPSQILEEGEEEILMTKPLKKEEANSKGKRSKRFAEDQFELLAGVQSAMLSDIHGDFKTDNVDSVEILGEMRSVLNCRVEVRWMPRDDGCIAMPTIYSSSYLRKHEPEILIDYLMNVLVSTTNSLQFKK